MSDLHDRDDDDTLSPITSAYQAARRAQGIAAAQAICKAHGSVNSAPGNVPAERQQACVNALNAAGNEPATRGPAQSAPKPKELDATAIYQKWNAAGGKRRR